MLSLSFFKPKTSNPASSVIDNIIVSFRDDKSYINHYYFKLNSQNATLPSIRVISVNQSDVSAYEDIVSPAIKLISLKMSEYNCGVLADDFKIISHQEKRYDDKSNLVLIEVNASMSNLEDFHLSFTLREALDSLEDNLDAQSMYYVSVVPKYQKEYKFKYFNLKTNSFNRISFPIVLGDSTLSTQDGLNPQKSKFFLYKINQHLSHLYCIKKFDIDHN